MPGLGAPVGGLLGGHIDKQYAIDAGRLTGPREDTVAHGLHRIDITHEDHRRALIVAPECRQFLEREGRLPQALVACVGGGSNAIGLFHAFLDDAEVALYGVEAAGKGLASGRHAAPLTANSGRGVLHGARSYLMFDEDGQIRDTHSISAGLDYPGVGPEHAWLKDSGRARYVAVDDEAALAAFHALTRLEGILPALESSHALAYAQTLAARLGPQAALIVNLSGRGDKDVETVAAYGEGKTCRA